MELDNPKIACRGRNKKFNSAGRPLRTIKQPIKKTHQLSSEVAAPGNKDMSPHASGAKLTLDAERHRATSAPERATETPSNATGSILAFEATHLRMPLY